jgi:hypothetical protein
MQNITFSILDGIQSALEQARSQNLAEIFALQNSTFSLIASIGAVVSKIFEDSGLQLAMFKNTTSFLLEDVYGDFAEMAVETEAVQKSILNATKLLTADVNDNTKYSLASAGARCVFFEMYTRRLIYIYVFGDNFLTLMRLQFRCCHYCGCCHFLVCRRQHLPALCLVARG